jgi:hypothetical protein
MKIRGRWYDGAMQKLKEQLRQFLAAAGLKKGNITRFIISLAIPLIFFVGYALLGGSFFEFLWILNGVLLGVILLIVAIIAGFAVVKSLFLVAGELSLLIFLSQSYCEIAARAPASDAALKNLLVLGLLYIGITFVRSLYEISKENYRKMHGERWSLRRIITIALFIILTGLFLWQIYLVVGPIITNLCVYK